MSEHVYIPTDKYIIDLHEGLQTQQLKHHINNLLNKVDKLEQENKEMRSLIDGCYDVVCLWEAKAPSQKDWKVKWKEGARRYGAISF